MKSLILLLSLLLLGPIANGQKIQKLIDKHNGGYKLDKYLDKGGDINEGIDVTYYDETGEVTKQVNALMYAVSHNNPDAFDVLIDRIEDFNESKKVIAETFVFSLSRDTNYYSEVLYKMDPNMEGFCEVCHGNNALMTAAVHDKEDWYFKLKDKSNLKYVNHAGANLLHAAAAGTNENILKDALAISEISDLLNAKDSRERTPLDYAVMHDDNSLYELVVAAGGKVEEAWNLSYGAALENNWEYASKDYANQQLTKDIWKTNSDGMIALSAAVIWDLERLEKQIGAKDIKQMAIANWILDEMTLEVEGTGAGNYSHDPFEKFPIVENIYWIISFCHHEDEASSNALMESLAKFHNAVVKEGKEGPLDDHTWQRGCKILGKGWMESKYDEFAVADNP